MKALKWSGTSAEAATKAERNFKTYVFMTWLDHYLQMLKGRSNIAATTREDNTEKYHSETDNLLANPISNV